MADAGEKTGMFIGVEFSGEVLRTAILSPDGSVVETSEAELNTGEDALVQLAALITGAKSKFPDAECVGVAVPGLLDIKTGRVAISKYRPENESIDLAGELSKLTGLKVRLENDGNAAAYAEFKLGAGRGFDDMFYITLGKGVGGALILNGKLRRGVSGFAGEFGYVAINSEGLRVEDMASAENIVRRTKDRLVQDHTTSLKKIEETLTVADIVAAANAEDDFAVMMMERTGMFVGTGVASVINLLNIERIVVGGEVMKAGEPVLKGITDRAKELSFAPGFAETTIVAGELGVTAAAIGAALLSCE